MMTTTHGPEATPAADEATPIVDFSAIAENLGEEYDHPVSVLDRNSNVVDQLTFDSYTEDELVHFLELMVWERSLHEQTIVFSRQGRLGFYAPTLGEEASNMGTITAFEPMDFLFPAYRDLPQLIQHGAITPAQGYLWSRGHVQGNAMADGHRAWMPQIIIGAQYVEAAGAALGIQKNGEPNVALAYGGDGTTSQGDFYEALNFAGAFQSPLIGIIQNNGWAISVPRSKQTHALTLAQKAVAAGIPSVQVDGMDILAVNAVTRAARAYAVAGNGPVLIETLTYRFGAHSSAGDDPSRYRTHDEEMPWIERDPLNRLRDLLVPRGLWSPEKESDLTEQYKKSFREALAEADKAPKQTVSEFLRNTYEVPTPGVAKQIREFTAKEGE
ncbi:thiamine pyrophosphate-dependent dehydrogenase E1 component subunit alpha [Pseudoclavibacter sp. 13-3]|uniref:thiamine pyrophosphate-dependent dehydrogenase E1 component subunit alpha n=1 Tax=Pseudoclavibacter sp. 13-3 TaxID=2901228 RepID=UPI001E31F87D|nr:thiamine pyrophosphate-dependent dehydrogenase E1 component subunit alpha [Pseudoclavibacter sp. 13-3]MCD7101809.1 thiamine pyrophosphate-dependent dehydrogenase E1 component subunit alpha [Pseudoclavibacter sp. 13-3]